MRASVVDQSIRRFTRVSVESLVNKGARQLCGTAATSTLALYIIRISLLSLCFMTHSRPRSSPILFLCLATSRHRGS